MRVLILGASGILGQHMRLCTPPGVEAIWHRKEADRLHLGCDLIDRPTLAAFLNSVQPDVIVNLAGENRTDTGGDAAVNVEAVRTLARYPARLVQVSTQAVFKGDDPPYGPSSPLEPVNEYGRQKAEAEEVARTAKSWCIIRPTFVLGRRPLPLVGRPNPVEQMPDQPRQVSDRFFSPLLAADAARLIWCAVVRGHEGIEHLGQPISVTRCDVAHALGLDAEPVKHSHFGGAARPRDTRYRDSKWLTDWEVGLKALKPGRNRAQELALFLGITEAQARAKLELGFGSLHGQVARDFRLAHIRTDEDLLEWYRTTDAYLWELSAYHDDPGFNYAGMIEGITARLRQVGARSVLCLGDGIGGLTLHLHQAGFEAHYHDLAGSRTAAFANFLFWMHSPTPVRKMLTRGWKPEIRGRYDAVISLDFLEHITDVPAWTEAIGRALEPGGWFFAQNAFGIGSGEEGSIPCHLARNDRFEKEWGPLLSRLRFEQEGASNWWRAA